MKEVANSLAQLLAIIMLTITFAISMAALSLWASSDAAGPEEPVTTSVQSSSS